MKKLLLTLICTAAFAGLTTAQEHPKNIFGIRAGLNVAHMTISDGDVSLVTKSRAGFHIGVSDQIRLSKIAPMYFETGLYLTQKGLKTENYTATPLYLQIPAQLNYHIYLGKGTSIDPFAGFYYGIGIGGRIKEAKHAYPVPNSRGYSEDTEADCFGPDSSLRRSDLGVRVGAAISFCHHFSFGVGYETSLININRDKEYTNGTTGNHNLTFTLGYNF